MARTASSLSERDRYPTTLRLVGYDPCCVLVCVVCLIFMRTCCLPFYTQTGNCWSVCSTNRSAVQGRVPQTGGRRLWEQPHRCHVGGGAAFLLGVWCVLLPIGEFVDVCALSCVSGFLAVLGGYGRLGLNNQNDSMTPAVVDTFNAQKNPRTAAKMICAGATCTYALTRAGQV